MTAVTLNSDKFVSCYDAQQYQKFDIGSVSISETFMFYQYNIFIVVSALLRLLYIDCAFI